MPPGIIKQTIKRPIMSDDRLYEIHYIFCFSNVTVNESRLARPLRLRQILQSAYDSSSFLFIITANDDLCPGFDKILRTTFADATAAAGNHHHFVCISQACHRNLHLLLIECKKSKGSQVSGA
jgi:hypothetical protein